MSSFRGSMLTEVVGGLFSCSVHVQTIAKMWEGLQWFIV